MTSPAIEMQSLEHRYDSAPVLQGIDLVIDHGEIFGFLGHNGAGKTTAVNILTTLITPTGGTARVCGFDVVRQRAEVTGCIGYLPSEVRMYPHLTAVENLEFFARLSGVAEPRTAARDTLDFLDCAEFADRRVGTFSSGMRQRVGIAQAILHRPKVLFLDEPTTGLDPVSRARVWEEVRHLNDDLGMTIFLTTQYLEEADVLADRVGIINEGKIVAEGTPEELKRSVGSDLIVVRVQGDTDTARTTVEAVDGVEAVSVRNDELTISVADGAARISPVAVALNGCGVKVLDLTLRTPTLDDVFLELTGAHIQHDEEGAA